MGEPTLMELFPKDGKYSFLVGAGCSMDPPSCMPSGKQMITDILQYTCEESEVRKLLGLEDLRYEQLMEIVRDVLDPELKIIDYFGLCDKPNLIHLFLAEMIKRGHFAMTTNFDYLIEIALLKSDIERKRIIPVITKEDFNKYQNPTQVVTEGNYPVYKIHGSTRNIITKASTRESLVATIQAFGSGKEGESVFLLEPFKRPFFENISRGQKLVVIGYSGSDDFDIVPTLKILEGLDSIIWIDHVSETSKMVIESSHTLKNDKISEILHDIQQAGNTSHVYRVQMPTTKITELFQWESNKVSEARFNINTSTYLQREITQPTDYQRNQIPYKIYFGFGMMDDAMRCSQRSLKLARTQENQEQMMTSLYNIALILIGQGKVEEGTPYLMEAQDIENKHRSYLDARGLKNEIEQLMKGKGDPEKFQQYTKKSKLFEQIGALQGEGKSAFSMGGLLLEKGRIDEALPYFKQALSIAKQQGNLQDRGRILYSIGSIMRKKNRLDEALKNIQEAFAISDQLGDRQGKSAALVELGHIMKGKGEYDEGIKYFKASLDILELLKNYRQIADILNEIGNLFYSKTEWESAINNYKKSLGIYDQIGGGISSHTWKLKTLVLHNLGLASYMKKDIDNALIFYQKALSAAEDSRNTSEKGRILNSIGVYHLNRGEWDDALKCYKESLEICNRGYDVPRTKAKRLKSIGVVYYQLLKFQEAIPYFEESLQIQIQVREDPNEIDNTKEWIKESKNKIST